MENCSYINDLQMDYLEFDALDEFKPPQNYQNPLPSHNKKMKKTNISWNVNINPSTTRTISPKNSSSFSSSHLISFGDPQTFNEEDDMIRSPTYLIKSCGYDEENKYAQQGGGQGITRGSGGMSARSPSHALDHVMAERKRREKLAQRIIALSAIIPGLKKADKASVLGEAIKYLKHLQERVKQLEEHDNKKSEELVVFVNKSNLCADEDSSLCEENSCGCFKESRCEIEARVSENNVLIKVHCRTKEGFIVKIIKEVEKLNLSMVNSSVLPFGNYAVDITIVAQMDAEYSLTIVDLVTKLRSALL